MKKGQCGRISVELKLTVPAARNRDSPDRQQEGVSSGGWQAARGQVAGWRPEGSERGAPSAARRPGRSRGLQRSRAEPEPRPSLDTVRPPPGSPGARTGRSPSGGGAGSATRRRERTGRDQRRGAAAAAAVTGVGSRGLPAPAAQASSGRAGRERTPFTLSGRGHSRERRGLSSQPFRRGEELPPNFLVPRRWNRAEPLRSDLQRTERALHSRQIQFGGEGDSPKGEETTPGWERLLPSSPGSPAECGDCATFPRWDRLLLPLPLPPLLLRGPSSPPQLGRLSQVQEEPLRMRLFICL
ncbi:uncharacterized protein LOC112391702 [Neophocaena asiaeorientalis asiaeorientalis]|uniref:Uncharacterized protein LOC112391702 n=1 Tax=Neophocaena asiaeorientalis asiaeorientalis TaxID=1706337 RepID=A0A341ADZ3_NEOAA|nr:uncharacterized protein LOC112391702 [Neophocaena asiaeorientalis asiaeorientalis]